MTHLRVVHSQPAAAPAQMSRPKGFARRRGEVSREEFLRFWSGLMMRRCGSARAVAYAFQVTEQTGRNWIDATACPTGWAVARAYSLWPGEFDAALADLRGAA